MKIKGDPWEILKKSEKKIKNEIFEQCHSAEKCKRGTIWDFLTSIVLQNIETNEGETLWWNQKKLQKSRIVRGSYVFEFLDVDVFVLDEVLAFRVCFGSP